MYCCSPSSIVVFYENTLDMSQERERECESVEAVLEPLPDKEYKEVWRILYGDGVE